MYGPQLSIPVAALSLGILAPAATGLPLLPLPVQGGDTCSQATPIGSVGSYTFDTSGATTSAFSGGGGCGGTSTSMFQDLFWVFTVPADGHYRFDTIGATFDTTLSLHAGSDCSATCVDHNDNSFWLNSALLVLRLEAGDELLVQVGGYLDESGVGSLQVSLQPDMCEGIVEPDYLEDYSFAYEGDTCATALPTGDGFYPGLNASYTDLDYYALTVAAGATLQIYFDEDPAGFDQLMPLLWDPSNTCEFPEPLYPWEIIGDVITDSFIEYTNVTGASQDLAFHVHVLPINGCKSYDMRIVGANGSFLGAPQGDNYCPAVPNSSGSPGQVDSFGSSLAQTNSLTLFASGLPQFSFGFFIVSRAQGFIANPGGSEGNLCVAGAIGRYVGPGQIKNSGAAGQIELAVDLTTIPQPLGPVAAVAGDSFNFQLWTRDNVGGAPTSNFTNGLSILFQ